MNIFLIRKFTICFVLMFYGASVFLSICAAQDWQSPHFQDHPLVGKIWDTHKNSWVTEKQLFAELLEYQYLLLGEAHTNADHHILQARIINHISSFDAKPVVVMEMLSKKQWQNLPRRWHNLENLKSQVQAHNDHWPWELYTPVLKSVVQHQLELVAGNISSSDLRAWSQNNNVQDGLTISEQTLEDLKEDIIDSHCGHANFGFVNFMVKAQLKRDQELTTNIVNSTSPVILITGKGHIKNTYAIPMHLRKRFSKYSYLSLAFIPVLPELSKPEDYIGENSSVFDVLYFTPNQTDQDPCIQFRKQLKNLHNRTAK